MSGKKQINTDRLTAGDIGALAKLQNTDTGGTLCDDIKVIVFPSVDFPQPCISLAVTAKKQGEEEKVFAGLHRLEEEDPSFKMVKQSDTPDTLVSGLGELHLEVVCKKLLNKFGVEAQLSDPGFLTAKQYARRYRRREGIRSNPEATASSETYL